MFEFSVDGRRTRFARRKEKKTERCCQRGSPAVWRKAGKAVCSSIDAKCMKMYL